MPDDNDHRLSQWRPFGWLNRWRFQSPVSIQLPVVRVPELHLERPVPGPIERPGRDDGKRDWPLTGAAEDRHE